MGPRTPGSLRVKWQTLLRGVQIYFGEVKYVEETPASGTEAADIEELAMKLYCIRTRKKSAHTTDMHIILLKYKETARYLKAHPNFGELTNNEEDALLGNELGRGGSSDAETEGGFSRDRGKQPKGQKRCQRDEKRRKEEEVLVETLKNIKEQINRTAEVMEKAVECLERSKLFERDFMLLQVLLEGSIAHARVLERIGTAEAVAASKTNGKVETTYKMAQGKTPILEQTPTNAPMQAQTLDLTQEPTQAGTTHGGARVSRMSMV